MYARRPTGCVWEGLAVLDSKVKARCTSCRSPSGNDKEVCRRVWRVVGVGVGLMRHDGEVEGVVVKAVELAHLGKVSKALGHSPQEAFCPLRKQRFETRSAHSCSPTKNPRLRVGVTSWYDREERILQLPCTSLSLVSVRSSGPIDNQG